MFHAPRGYRSYEPTYISSANALACLSPFCLAEILLGEPRITLARTLRQALTLAEPHSRAGHSGSIWLHAPRVPSMGPTRQAKSSRTCPDGRRDGRAARRSPPSSEGSALSRARRQAGSACRRSSTWQEAKSLADRVRSEPDLYIDLLR